MLCAPVFIFTAGSSALLGRPRCSLSIWLSLLAIFNTLFWVYVDFVHDKTDKTRKYSKSAIFLWRLLGAQSINTESLFKCCRFTLSKNLCSLAWRFEQGSDLTLIGVIELCTTGCGIIRCSRSPTVGSLVERKMVNEGDRSMSWSPRVMSTRPPVRRNSRFRTGFRIGS